MTVYKHGSKLAPRPVESAGKFSKREKLETTSTTNNGSVDVASIQVQAVVVNKANLDETVIKHLDQKWEDTDK